MTPFQNILTQARDALTENNWNKGRYFSAIKFVDDPPMHFCRCAHGQVRLLINPLLRAELAKNYTDVDDLVFKLVLIIKQTPLIAASEAESQVEHFANLMQLWNICSPTWIENQYHDDLRIHYLMGIVGLTSGFNDHPDTTLNNVKHKLDEAIRLAGQLGI